LSDKYKEKLNFIRREDGLPLIENDELIIPANVVRKLREKRIGLDGKTPDEVADILANVFHKEGNSVFRTKHSHIQGIADIHQGESLSEIGFVSINPATGETVIKSVYPEKTKRVIKKFKDINIGEAPVLSYATDVHQPAAGRLSVVNVNKSIAKTAKSVNSENVYINFARIDTPDDIKKVMAELADASRESIDKARRFIFGCCVKNKIARGSRRRGLKSGDELFTLSSYLNEVVIAYSFLYLKTPAEYAGVSFFCSTSYFSGSKSGALSA